MNVLSRWKLATALVMAFVPMVGAGEPQDPSADVTVVRRALVEYEHNTPVGPSSFGTLKECLVAPGDRVKAGQVIGRLFDDDLRADIRLKELEASSDVDIRLGEARLAKLENKRARTGSLVNRNVASKEQYNIDMLEAAAASLEVEQAKFRQQVAVLHLEQSKIGLKTRELVAPHDGVVSAVTRRKGETIAPRDPVFQVVDTEHLRVVGQVDVTEAWRLKIGQSVRVIPDIAGADLPLEHEVFNGRLTFVDTLIDPLTRTCKIHVETLNRGGLLRAGLEARIEIDPAPAVAEAPTAQ